jgi:hypothetical protein
MLAGLGGVQSMQTFAVVAVRLIGLWIIAGSTSAVAILVMNVVEGSILAEMWEETWLHTTAAMLAPPITGALLIAFSKPIAGLISRGISSPPPDAVTASALTRVGVFLLGLFALLHGLPFVVQSVFGRMEIGLNFWLTAGFGLLLVLLASPIGDVLQRLRGRD